MTLSNLIWIEFLTVSKMKEVIFVRHAKSDWGNESLKDIDRHLSERGYNDAYFLSEWFAENQKAPSLIISSTATRALNTALIFARSMDFNMEGFRINKKIYEASVDTLVSILKQQDGKSSSVMMCGHNPGFTNICNELSEEMFFDNVPTCGIVSMTFNILDWSGIELKKGKLNYYKFPKDFKNQS